MRRFIVIFLLLLLPIQVLAESLGDLRAVHQRVVVAQTAEITPISVDVDVKRSSSSPDASNPQQAAHADIGDAASSAALYVLSPLSAGLWPDYLHIAFPSVYLPVIKPPLI